MKEEADLITKRLDGKIAVITGGNNGAGDNDFTCHIISI
jgi:hypothetical protein